jgi:tetratricopeptide (TPR) repeat protein
MTQQPLACEVVDASHPLLAGLDLFDLRVLLVGSWSWPHTDKRCLRRSLSNFYRREMAEPLEGSLRKLSRRGLLRQLDDGTWVVSMRSSEEQVFHKNEVQRMRRVIMQVLEPGTRGRLHHILAIGTVRELLDEAYICLDRARRREGSLALAWITLREALSCLRDIEVSEDDLKPVFRVWFLLVCSLQDSYLLDWFVLELLRLGGGSRFTQDMLKLADATQRVRLAAHWRSLVELGQLRFDDVELESLRLSMLSFSVRYTREHGSEDLNREFKSLAEGSGHRSALRRWMEVQGRTAYREGDFDRAASFYSRAMEVEDVDPSFALQINRLRALLEGF